MFLSNFESNLQLDDGLNNALSESEPAILFSHRPVSELDAAAVKLQKVYKSYRIRRNLADCAAAIEELWWKALDDVARKPISEHDAAVMIQKAYLSYRADHNSFKSTQSDGAETINVNDLNGNAPILTVCSEKKNSDWYTGNGSRIRCVGDCRSDRPTRAIPAGAEPAVWQSPVPFSRRRSVPSPRPRPKIRLLARSSTWACRVQDTRLLQLIKLFLHRGSN